MRQLDLSLLRAEFEAALDDYILHLDVSIDILKPMIYSLKGGGKRLRPLLLLATLEINNRQLIEYGMRTAIALEHIHTYSLIHDDLPAMDNDDLRRGNPTSHIQFNEATAILAGDALLTDAFGIIAQDDHLKAKQKVALISKLVQASGSVGMVAGQLKDIEGQNSSLSLAELNEIHYLKTGCLFNYSLEAAAIILNMEDKARKLLERFGNAFGIAYQIHNDLMDVLGNVQVTGKHGQADAALNKATYPALIGVEESKASLNKEIKKAKIALKRLSNLTEQPYYLLETFIDYLNLDYHSH